MPQTPTVSGQDWETVVIRKKQPAKPKDNDEALRVARQTGAKVETVKKVNAGKNANHSGPQNAWKLDAETEELAVPKISHNVAMRIQQARLAKGWTQKDLAVQIAEKTPIVNEYESGRAVPNNQILGKMEKALGVKLRGQL
jgi:putative transcription factor